MIPPTTTKMRRLGLWMLVCCLGAATVFSKAPPTTNATKRKLYLLNESGSRLEVYWIHPDSRKGSLMSTPHVINGAQWNVDTFVGHEFEVRELPRADGKCLGGKECRRALFPVSANIDQVTTVTKDMTIEFVDDQIRAKREAAEMVEECQSKAKEALKKASTKETPALLDTLVNCVEEKVTTSLVKATEEIAFQSRIRTVMAEKMENYTCADPKSVTSDALETKVWRGSADNKARTVNVLLDRPSSRIHLLEDFIDADECKAMEEAAKPKLHRATVADGKGGSEHSENRKAMQAGIKVQWNKEKEGDLIARISRRVYDYTNFVLNLGIKENGQEDLMSIQYFGKGRNSTDVPDRYTPHCDGECTGMKFKEGNRMATMVMYCDIPEDGGHTNFRNAGVHVKPSTGSAVFFSYIDPKTKLMDNGFTEHSGCPVYEGEKKIVTQWIRVGVDDENPWDSFNTLGLKKSDVAADEKHHSEQEL